MVDGKLVELPVSNLAAFVNSRLASRLTAFVEQHGLGATFTQDLEYRCFPNSASTSRKPDLTFIRSARIPPEMWTLGSCPFPPDLAVEVVSENDTVVYLNRKLEEYFAVSIPLVWVIDPSSVTAWVLRADGSAARLRGGQAVLDGEDVVPGFSCPLASILPTPPAPTPAS